MVVGRRQSRLLGSSVLLVLELSPVRRDRLVATCLLYRAAESRGAGVQLVSLVAVRSGPVAGLALVRDGHVATESLAHVDHASLTLAETLLQLLALGRESRG